MSSVSEPGPGAFLSPWSGMEKTHNPDLIFDNLVSVSFLG
jgi:hypothetical protein